MAPPGGGRTAVTQRFLRHFNVLSITDFDEQTLGRIYNAIMSWHMEVQNFDQGLRRHAASVVSATTDVFMAASKQLLPTPSKSHYTFNVRDFSRVVQGVCLANPKTISEPRHLLRLWAHEVLRVFCDRLIDGRDQALLQIMIAQAARKRFNIDIGVELGGEFDSEHASMLMYGDFCHQDRRYAAIPDTFTLQQSLENAMDELNASESGGAQFVLFRNAAEHVLRMCRILRLPRGHALLVGLGGSGRRSLARLATSAADCELFQIEPSQAYGRNEWREDLKLLLKKAATGERPVVFLLSDAQIKDDYMLEDVNNLLNSGEVPNLYAADELTQITEAIRARAKRSGKLGDGTPAALYAAFVDLCRRRLHAILVMSPVGAQFRTRLRMFPSLVNCCTIDWFGEWPSDALQAVGQRSTLEIDMPDTMRDSAIALCMQFHQSTIQASAKFLAQERRQTFVTPASFLDLLHTFDKLYGRKRAEIATFRRRYENGLTKLDETSSSVKEMQAELEALKPRLIQTQAETDQLMTRIEAESHEVSAVRTVVSAEEVVANKKADAAKAIRDECEADLREAIPILESAISALDTLKPADISVVKTMKHPPDGVKLVMEAVCVLMGVAPVKVTDPTTMKKEEDYWPSSVRILGDTNFINLLKALDKDNVSPAIIKTLREKFIPREDFVPERVVKASSACEGLCRWVRAIEQYDRVAKIVAPKKAALAVADSDYAVTMEGLNAKRAALREVEGRLEALRKQLDQLMQKKLSLEEQVEECTQRLQRAERLLVSLGGERSRWTAEAARFAALATNTIGDILLSAGFIAYLGPFTLQYRQELLAQWVIACNDRRIPCSPDFSLASVLGNPIQLRKWRSQGLPADSFSSDNAAVVFNSRRYCLLIDPQQQGSKWIKKMEAENNLRVLKAGDGDFLRHFKNAVQFGQPVLLENLGEELDPVLDMVLLKQTFKNAGVECVRIGDATVEMNPAFQMFMSTKLRNPSYSPDIAIKVTLLNFMITPEGLQDQLLGIVVSRERPELEKQLTELILEGAENRRLLQEIEDRILQVLDQSENILADESAIQVLSDSKRIANEVTKKQKVTEETEVKINLARQAYVPVAKHAAVLFFCISDLASIEAMYQYSLVWFLGLFVNSIEKSARSPEVDVRIKSLNDHFTYSLYCNVCRSLFEKDKLVFSFLLCSKILISIGEVTNEQWRFLLTGGVALDNPYANQASDWLPEKAWGEICRLSDIKEFEGLRSEVNTAAWKALYDSQDPHAVGLPGSFAARKLSPFQVLMVLRCLRPDKLINGVTNFVANRLGQQYVEPPPFDLAGAYADSSATAALIFMLSPGSDPLNALLSFAEQQQYADKMRTISLGQGQGPRAAALITEGVENGNWVVLQNCHLAVSWLPTLEQIVEGLHEHPEINPGFRLWLTSYPSPKFPISILQDGVKLTNEAPKGLRANLLRTYLSDPIADRQFFDACSKRREWRILLFGLAFFHAVVQERRQFGPLGWNIPYEFNESDLRISVRQLQAFLNEYENVPYKALVYLTGHCNYGGRVTDEWDRRTLLTILEGFCNPGILDKSNTFSESGTYFAPDTAYGGAVDFIKKFPATAHPEVFGLHSNAAVTTDLQETSSFFDAILLTESNNTSSGGGKTAMQIVVEVAADIEGRLPANFDLEEVGMKYPVVYEESMNTVLRQEVIRFNRLLTVVRSTMSDLQKAVKGLVVMSAELEVVATALFNGKVPAVWSAKSYPSLKPLASYVADLLERIAFFNEWIARGPPVVFWLSGFFFTQSFLTGALQNYARKHGKPIDTVGFDFEMKEQQMQTLRPENGVLVRGLFLEGARWDSVKQSLTESSSKVLFTPAPIMWLKPEEAQKFSVYQHYDCPVYKTSARRGVLSTTGHSTNFVMSIRLPSRQESSHWIKRGVALLCQLSD
eukprot:TRINITY_DN713_c0_g3_i1.p1 TRINITY_DN713_c0_g3~~TRINITY_DN713_c0_g3_i1.p1  ORF type:complete len:2250 (-),score=595.98 TRINITY_DN713_c0_g3_i1:82-5835(-)